MSTPKIVRKARQDGVSGEIAFWLAYDSGEVQGWYQPSVLSIADVMRAGGWYAEDRHATACGTTLAAIRAELLALETPTDAPLTPSEREELVKLQRFAGLMMACANAGTDGGYIQDQAVELGLMVPTVCDGSCEYCCGEPGEDTCYRPRYDKGGTPIGEVGG